MTAITQKIPNFVGGISQQPDELMPYGTVRDALNVIPDVRGVISKRPGSELVGTLSTNTEGVWYDYYRDEDEQYVIRVRRNGVVDIWDTDGVPLAVTYTEKPWDPTEGITGKPGTGLLPPEQEAPNRNPQFPNCDIAALTRTRDTLQAAANALYQHKVNIERLTSQRQNLINQRGGYIILQVNDGVINAGAAYKKSRQREELYSPRGRPSAPGSDVDLVEVQRGTIYTFETRPGPPDGRYPPRVIKTKHKDAYIWGWRVRPSNIEGQINNLTNQINAENGKTQGLLNDYNAKLEIYEVEAVKCGIFDNPFSRTATFKEDEATPVPYLAHETDDQLQFITINDYTFVTNRKAVPRMNSVKNIYRTNTESFVTLDVLQQYKPYTLHMDLLDNDGETTYTRATQLEVSPGSWNDGDGSCPFTATKDFTVSQGGAEDLKFRLTTIGSQYYDSGSDADSPDYDCRYKTTVELLSSGQGWGVGQSVTVNMEGRDYVVTVTQISNVKTSAEIIIDSAPLDSDDPLNSDVILANLRQAILDKTFGFEVQIIGNGLWINDPSNTRPFKMTTPDRQYLTCINDTVNNISQLPNQCKDGFIVKVVNSFVEEDDYWVVYKGEEDGVDGAGYWQETNDPKVEITFDWESMPYQIRRLPNRSFEIRPVLWGQREVGDDVTNPQPSFIGTPINKMVFFKNRLTFLSGETVVMSRPNEYFNFWAFTAKAVSPADPIDVRVSSTYPSILYDGIDTAAGLMVFSENHQHLVVTDNTDALTPETVSVKSIGTYQFNVGTKPVDMGQTVGFLNNAGYKSRFFEIIPSRDYNYAAVEVSKPVDHLIPQDINLVASSKDNNLITFAVKGTSDVWVYRFFQNDTERKQSAWFRWTVDGTILHHFTHKNKYYLVTQKNTGSNKIPAIVTLQEISLNIDREDALITLTDNMRTYDYQVHLDSYFMVTASEMIYDESENTTSFRLPIGYHGEAEPMAFELNLDRKSGETYITEGRTANFKSLEGIPNGVWGTLEGDWRERNTLVGFPFEMKINLPNFYLTQTAGSTQVKDVRSSLTLHRVNLVFEATGLVDVIVERKGREDFTVSYEATTQDGYLSDYVAIEREVTRTIPIYHPTRHTDIYVTSSHPTATSLISASWEGDYNTRNYRNA